MPKRDPDYFGAFSTLALSRTPSGVLTLRFHNGGGPAAFSGPMQAEMPRALAEIADDRANRVLILTGTGDRFMTDVDKDSLGDLSRPDVWARIWTRGTVTMQRLVDLEMPIVAAVNGPVSIHSEWAMLADIVVAADTTVFSDYSHPTFGTVPGDGVHLVWEEVLGLNRSRHLSLTGGTFTAEEAHGWGVVAEIHPLDEVVPRAEALAEALAAKQELYTRFISVTMRQRLSRRVREGTRLGLALEGLAASDTAYHPPPKTESAMTVTQDLDARSHEIAWPPEFDPASGDLFAHNEIRIEAPPEAVWQGLVEATRWPEFYPNSKDVRIEGDDELRDGTVFRWSTFGLDIESRVVEFEPFVRLGWYGYAPGEAPAFFHRWLIKPEGAGCLVITEETGIGPGAAQMREEDEGRMHRGHGLWLATLKWRVEETTD